MKYQTLVEKQRSFFNTNQTKSYAFRKAALIKLKNAIITYEKDILQALHQDLGKSAFEGYLTEVGITLLEVNYAIKHLKTWMKRKSVKSPITLFKAKSYLYQEPYGVVLIMSPWNYPFQLTIAPLIGAIAAGNTAVLKVSPDSIKTSEILDKMISEIYPEAFVKVVHGGLDESKKVLAERYDYIFFTGSTAVGKIVMEVASKHLIPVTLELGGKSPSIIDETVDLDLTAKRIIYGKYVNAGQTCIAPDYIYIKADLKDHFIDLCKKYIQVFFSEHPLDNHNYPKIINEKQYQRLMSLMKDGKPVYGGKASIDKIEPTLLVDVNLSSPLMQEEIFGPLLPILTYQHEAEVISILKAKEKPLALYIFTKHKAFEKKILSELSFGGATINDTLMHFGNHHLPFGGVGYSGMGSYHGLHSFKTFSHEKGVVRRSTWVDLFLRYPRYEEKKLKLIKKIIK
jgi:aldehyde dehydrogenase (NAD+)